MRQPEIMSISFNEWRELINLESARVGERMHEYYLIFVDDLWTKLHKQRYKFQVSIRQRMQTSGGQPRPEIDGWCIVNRETNYALRQSAAHAINECANCERRTDTIVTVMVFEMETSA